MLEIVIGKCDYMAKMVNIAFNVDVVYYPTENGITDMRVPKRVCSGVYLTDNIKEPDISSSQTLSSLDVAGELEKPIIVFNSIHIVRELTEKEKYTRSALEQFLKTEIEHPEVKIGQTYEEVVRFKTAVDLLKDKEVVSKLLPVPVESIAFIELMDTEGDFILSKEANLIDTWTAINGNTFNIYKLW